MQRHYMTKELINQEENLWHLLKMSYSKKSARVPKVINCRKSLSFSVCLERCLVQ